MRRSTRLFLAALVAGGTAGCATDSKGGTDRATDVGGGTGNPAGGPGAGGDGIAGSGAGDFGNTGTRGAAPMEIVNVPGEDGNCGATSMEAEQVVVEEEIEVPEEVTSIAPVAINIMLDQSGSMAGSPLIPGFGIIPDIPAVPALWPGAVNSINAFVNDPKSAGLEVALQYFPVGGFQCNGTGYDKPEVPMAPLPGNAAAISASLAGHSPNGNTPTEGALRGATSYCQTYMPPDPNEKCVTVLITDGLPTECDKNANTLAGIAGTAAAAGVITYAVGLQGSDFTLLDQISMQGGAKDCDAAAATYACDVTAGSNKLVEVLNTIRETVVTTVTHTETVTKMVEKPLDCEFQLPPPENVQQGFDKDEVNVRLTGTGVQETTLGRVPAKGDCAADAWYYDDPAKPTRIIACPATCDTIQTTEGAKIDILLGCPTIDIG